MSALRPVYPIVAPSTPFETPGFFPRQRPRKSVLSSTTAPPKKRRKLDAKPADDIAYDGDKRADYLTGFHKRKLERIKRAKEEESKKAREERVLMRKQLREERKQDLTAHIEAVNTLLADQDTFTPASLLSETTDGEEPWSGIAESSGDDEDAPTLISQPGHQISEYIDTSSDDEKHISVTIEDISITHSGLHRVLTPGEESALAASNARKAAEAHAAAVKEAARKAKFPKKEKKKPFRYESKAERKFTRGKQQGKNRRAAEARKG